MRRQTKLLQRQQLYQQLKASSSYFIISNLYFVISDFLFTNYKILITLFKIIFIQTDPHLVYYFFWFKVGFYQIITGPELEQSFNFDRLTGIGNDQNRNFFQVYIIMHLFQNLITVFLGQQYIQQDYI